MHLEVAHRGHLHTPGPALSQSRTVRRPTAAFMLAQPAALLSMAACLADVTFELPWVCIAIHIPTSARRLLMTYLRCHGVALARVEALVRIQAGMRFMGDSFTQVRSGKRLRHVVCASAQALGIKSRVRQSYLWAGVVVSVTALFVLAYYINHPAPDVGRNDTAEYLTAAQHIETQGRIVDPQRLPGFPLLIALVFSLAGRGNLLAVSIANALLFLVAVLEIYIIAALTLGRRWVTILLGIGVGTNAVLLSFVKPILAESLALWLVASLTLAAVLFVHTLRPRYLWLAAAAALGLSKPNITTFEERWTRRA